MGYTISRALTSGFQRGMFSNEAGMGSSPNAAAAASGRRTRRRRDRADDWRVYRYYRDLYRQRDYRHAGAAADNEYTLNGIQDLQHAMSVLVGGWGAGFIALIVLLFAFSSIVANYVYAENNLVFLRG